jgi:hypothetical protein
MSKSKKPGKGYWRYVYRDAITGQLVSETYALRHPNTTIKQKIWVPQ